MTELTSRTLIVTKGILFLFVIAASAGLILLEHPSLRVVFLLAVLIWASARFYYFVFYVLEKYVDPRLKYAGLFALLAGIRRRRASP